MIDPDTAKVLSALIDAIDKSHVIPPNSESEQSFAVAVRGLADGTTPPYPSSDPVSVGA